MRAGAALLSPGKCATIRSQEEGPAQSCAVPFSASARTAIGSKTMVMIMQAPHTRVTSQSRREELSTGARGLIHVEMGRDAWEGIFIDERASSGRPADRASQSHKEAASIVRPLVHRDLRSSFFRRAGHRAPCTASEEGGGGRADSVCAVHMYVCQY